MVKDLSQRNVKTSLKCNYIGANLTVYDNDYFCIEIVPALPFGNSGTKKEKG